MDGCGINMRYEDSLQCGYCMMAYFLEYFLEIYVNICVVCVSLLAVWRRICWRQEHHVTRANNDATTHYLEENEHTIYIYCKSFLVVIFEA